MRKSVLGIAAVAAMGLAGAANAGWFTIQTATTVGATLTTPTGSYTSGNASAAFNLGAGTVADAGATGVSFGSGTALTTSVLGAGDTSAIAAAVGATAGQLTYFGFDTGGGAPAFFGFIYQTAGAGEQFSWNFSNASSANVANGVFASADLGYTGGTGVGNGWSGNSFFGSVTSTGAGEIYLGIFAGMQADDFIGGANVSDTTFDVRYLSHDGTNWTVAASANGATSSNLNVATYNIPVPAPVLLAGAGLIGAAALRRRMVKKG